MSMLEGQSRLQILCELAKQLSYLKVMYQLNKNAPTPPLLVQAMLPSGIYESVFKIKN